MYLMTATGGEGVLQTRDLLTQLLQTLCQFFVLRAVSLAALSFSPPLSPTLHLCNTLFL